MKFYLNWCCTWTYNQATLKELERHLNRFIDWYNNERMLKKFNYKTPHELWVEFCKK
ncbi:IS3 family transposase [Mycoplasmopsis bovis]|uniref:IS3 family transposase n=1 Tax=Mycoplasmopsis bovis TaxID=28903 RepID=UPI000E1B7B6C